MKVLFADDKNTWHILIDKVLKPREIEVVHSKSLKETLNKVFSDDPDVVLIDVSLENGKAYNIIPEILKNGFPVVLIGLKSEGLDEGKARELGVEFVMRKPFTIDDLIKTLNEAKLKKKPSERKVKTILPSGKTIEELPVVEEIPSEPAPEKELEIQPIEIEPTPSTSKEAEPIEIESVPSTAEEKEESLEAKIPMEKVNAEVKKILKEEVEKVVREIAWEIIPEIAEKVIREEIEKLIKSRSA
jgi:DNA-binding response OmpR family regulator